MHKFMKLLPFRINLAKIVQRRSAIMLKACQSHIKRKITLWKQICMDYIKVAESSVKFVLERPGQSLGVATVTGIFTSFAVLNPDEKCFKAQFLSSSADLGTVTPQLQNIRSVSHLQWLRMENNLRRLRRINFILFSLMYTVDKSEYCCKYDTSCTYLFPSLWKCKDRIVDIGFLNRWWILEKRMENYDVNY